MLGSRGITRRDAREPNTVSGESTEIDSLVPSTTRCGGTRSAEERPCKPSDPGTKIGTECQANSKTKATKSKKESKEQEKSETALAKAPAEAKPKLKSQTTEQQHQTRGRPPHVSASQATQRAAKILLVFPNKSSLKPPEKLVLEPEDLSKEHCFEWIHKEYYTIEFRDTENEVFKVNPVKHSFRVTYEIWRMPNSSENGEAEKLNSANLVKPWNSQYFYFSAAKFQQPGIYEVRFSAENLRYPEDKFEPLVFRIEAVTKSASKKNQSSKVVNKVPPSTPPEEPAKNKVRKRNDQEASAENNQPLGPASKKAHKEETDPTKSSKKNDEPIQFDVAVNLPQKLVERLLMDWENVTKKKLLVPLPRTPSVKDIIQLFQKDHKLIDFLSKDIFEKLMICFDGLLGQTLLYRFEREQYQKIIEENQSKKPTDLYGAEHLLRLIITLPRLLGEVDPKDVTKPLSINDRRNTRQLAHPQEPDFSVYLKQTEHILNDLSEFLTNDKAAFFSPEYVCPPSNYSAEIPT